MKKKAALDQESVLEISRENTVVSRLVRRITSSLIIFVCVYTLSLLLAKAVMIMNLDKLQILFSGTLDKATMSGVSGLLKLAGILMNSTMFNRIVADGKMIQLGFVPLLLLPIIGIIIGNFNFYTRKPTFTQQWIEYSVISGIYSLLILMMSGLIQLKDTSYNAITLFNGVFGFILMVLLQYIVGAFFIRKGRKSIAAKYFDLYSMILFVLTGLGVMVVSFKIFGLKELYFSFLILLNGIGYGILFMAGVPLEYSILGDKSGLTVFHVIFQDTFLKLFEIPLIAKIGAVGLVLFYFVFLFLIIGKVLRKSKWKGIIIFSSMVGAFFFLLSQSTTLLVKNAVAVASVDVSVQFGANPLLAVLISMGTCFVMAFLHLILSKVSLESTEDDDDYDDEDIE